MRSPVLLALVLLAAGCGIPEAVGNQCGGEEQTYEQLQRKSTGLASRGLTSEAPIVRHTQEDLARARQAYLACTARAG